MSQLMVQTLLIFDLNGTLGYVTKNLKNVNHMGIYQGLNEVKPVYEDTS
jgi:hypothetical protein